MLKPVFFNGTPMMKWTHISILYLIGLATLHPPFNEIEHMIVYCSPHFCDDEMDYGFLTLCIEQKKIPLNSMAKIKPIRNLLHFQEICGVEYLGFP